METIQNSINMKMEEYWGYLYNEILLSYKKGKATGLYNIDDRTCIMINEGMKV